MFVKNKTVTGYIAVTVFGFAAHGFLSLGFISPSPMERKKHFLCMIKFSFVCKLFGLRGIEGGN